MTSQHQEKQDPMPLPGAASSHPRSDARALKRCKRTVSHRGSPSSARDAHYSHILVVIHRKRQMNLARRTWGWMASRRRKERLLCIILLIILVAAFNAPFQGNHLQE